MSRATARVSAKEVQGCTLIRIEGEINETFDASSFSGRSGVVLFDLGGVRRITSHGVLQWITALRALPASYYCFINCRPNTMDQFNLVQAFPQRGELISFFANFACSECGHESEELVDLRHHFEIHETLSLAPIKCSRCGGQAEFDEVPELYFKYVLSAPTPRPPPAAVAVIGGGESAGGARGKRFELKKDVYESVTAFWLSGYLDERNYFKRAADGVDGPAIIEIGELEGISEAGGEGFKSFLGKLDGRGLLARVPLSLVDTLAALLSGRRGAKAGVLSFLVPLRCSGCRQLFGGDITADKLADLASGASSEICPHCMHPLEPQCSTEMAAGASMLPIATATDDVRTYLRAHPPSARLVGFHRVEFGTDTRRLLLGKYQVLHPLGRGGMGEVFLARQVGPESFEKLLVLKRIRRDRLRDRQSRDLFLKEARIAARLSHRNIVQIFDLERVDDEYFISMEYVNGIDLAAALQVSRQLRVSWPIDICCRVVAELCSGLHAAHTYVDDGGKPSPIIHRDVSPSNILLSTEGAVKLTDFGIARIASEPTVESGVSGKAGYSAPEQWSDPGAGDERSDTYGVGAVLFECVTLRPMMKGASSSTGQSGPGWRPHSAPQICVARSGTPPLLQDVFERAVQQDPRLRYSSARELGRDLERIGRLVGETTTDDLALWVRRLVALQLEASGYQASPIVTLNTGGQNSVSGSHRLPSNPAGTVKF